VIVSVVVPTYNRGNALGPMLDRLLASDRRGLVEVEVIVVDDGSPVPPTSIVNTRQPPLGVTLKCVRQENGGPAAARNLGFATSHGDIVIFIDDDILVPPGLIRQHVEAHELKPGAVIFGVCVPPTGPGTHAGRVLESIYGNRDGGFQFERVSLIASGQLSVERRLFPTGVYAGELKTPGAEEFELSARLRQREIAAFKAMWIKAIHDQPFDALDLCTQQFKHGMGCAEVVCRMPSVRVLVELETVAVTNGPILRHDPLIGKCKKVMKSFLAARWVRPNLISVCRLADKVFIGHSASDRLLRLAIGAFFFAGYRDGLRRFGPT
jgi:glycosyltransferase involved in cell wall biosynthesis